MLNWKCDQPKYKGSMYHRFKESTRGPHLLVVKLYLLYQVCDVLVSQTLRLIGLPATSCYNFPPTGWLLMHILRQILLTNKNVPNSEQGEGTLGHHVIISM